MRSFRTHLAEAAGEWRKVGGQLGSNEGGVYEHPETGEKHYVKFAKNPDQGRSEVLASRIYQHMGIHTTEPQTVHVNGREATASKWVPELKEPHHGDFRNLNPEQHKQIGRIYHGAVLTKDWDVMGTGGSYNVARHHGTGDMHAMDQGAAFRYRAQGAPKPNGYGPDVSELHSLRHNDGQSGEVFHHVLSKDPEAYRAGHTAVAGMDMDHVHHLFRTSGVHDWEDLHRNFVSRREALLKAGS